MSAIRNQDLHVPIGPFSYLTRHRRDRRARRRLDSADVNRTGGRNCASCKFNYIRGRPTVSHRDRQLQPSRDDNATSFPFLFLFGFFFFSRDVFPRRRRPFLQEAFSHNSNYPRRPARAPRQRARRALISGSLVGRSQKIPRKKLPVILSSPRDNARGVAFHFFPRLSSLPPAAPFVFSFSPRCRAGEQVSLRSRRGGIKERTGGLSS